MTNHTEADPVWEQKYSSGHAQRWPWDVVVSFVFRNAPRDRPRQDVSILEVGCGTGSNLWFMAREGFRAFGIDSSPSAIAAAKARMEAEGLPVSLRVGSFSELPWPDQHFDLAVDRGALTCVGRSVARKALDELYRTLKPGAALLFNGYSAAHGSRLTGAPGEDGLTVEITGGTLKGAGHIRFYSLPDVHDALGEGFAVESCRHLVEADPSLPQEQVHAEWRVVARRK